MKEVTRITTLKITEAFKMADKTELQEKNEYGKELAEDVKTIFKADHVEATEVQDFVADVNKDLQRSKYMSHIETLVMNEVRNALEKLQRQGVGYIDYETTGNICYSIDDRNIRISIETISDLKAEALADMR